jgi:hypothetical protein
LPRGLDPADDRQRDIEHRDVRLMMERKLHRLATVTRFRAHLEFLTRFEKRAQAAPDNRVVVG